jgi:hypothetical protein
MTPSDNEGLLRKLRLALQGFALVGLLLFGSAFALTFGLPAALEGAAKAFIRAQIEREIGAAIDHLDPVAAARRIAQRVLGQVPAPVVQAALAAKDKAHAMAQEMAKARGQDLTALAEGVKEKAGAALGNRLKGMGAHLLGQAQPAAPERRAGQAANQAAPGGAAPPPSEGAAPVDGTAGAAAAGAAAAEGDGGSDTQPGAGTQAAPPQATLRDLLKQALAKHIDPVLSEMRQPDCTCRAQHYETAKHLAALALEFTMERLTANLADLIRGKYQDIVGKLLQDLRIFTGANTVAFLLLALLVFFKGRAARQLLLPGILLLLATGIASYAYLFQQDWWHSILYSDYWGTGYVAYLSTIYAFLCDVAFNRARVTSSSLNAIAEMVPALANVLTCVPCWSRPCTVYAIRCNRVRSAVDPGGSP